MVAWLGCAPLASGLEPALLLEAERAFALSVQATDARTLVVRYRVADGYYLYRDRLKFATSPAAQAGAPALPPGRVKDDVFFGRVETYRGMVAVTIDLDRERPGETVTLVADSQGCADLGVCYPPQRQTLSVPLPRRGEPPGPAIDATPHRKGWFN